MYQPRAYAPARRDGAAVRVPRQARHGRQRGGRARSRAGRLARGAQLLRDRRGEHATSLYQRFRLMRGEIDAGEYAREIALVRERHRGVGCAALEGVSRGLGRALIDRWSFLSNAEPSVFASNVTACPPSQGRRPGVRSIPLMMNPALAGSRRKTASASTVRNGKANVLRARRSPAAPRSVTGCPTTA